MVSIYSHLTVHVEDEKQPYYAPVWHQRGFWQPGKTTLAYLNLEPDTFTRLDGLIGYERALHDAPPARAFVQRDLYSTFFGTAVIDEIERKLFGDIKRSKIYDPPEWGRPNKYRSNP